MHWQEGIAKKNKANAKSAILWYFALIMSMSFVMITSQYLFKMFRLNIDYSNFSKDNFDLGFWTITTRWHLWHWLYFLCDFYLQSTPFINLWEKCVDLIKIFGRDHRVDFYVFFKKTWTWKGIFKNRNNLCSSTEMTLVSLMRSC